jgi:hypothetical protein
MRHLEVLQLLAEVVVGQEMMALMHTDRMVELLVAVVVELFLAEMLAMVPLV